MARNKRHIYTLQNGFKVIIVEKKSSNYLVQVFNKLITIKDLIGYRVEE